MGLSYLKTPFYISADFSGSETHGANCAYTDVAAHLKLSLLSHPEQASALLAHDPEA